MEEKNNEKQLSKGMNAGAVWALAVGAIIGWGCFIQGGEWTKQAGGPVALILGFVIGVGLMIVIGLCYSYLIPKIRVAGGEFAYAYYSFGRKSAFACGWMMLLGYITLAAMNATAIPVLASYIFPKLFKFGYLYTVAGYRVYLGEVLLSIFFLLLFAVLNYWGIRKTGKIQLYMAILLCLTVAIAVAGTFVTGGTSIENLKPYYGANKSLVAGVLSILVVTPYCFVGFDTIPQAAEEYAFPHEKVKQLIVSALLIGALIYISMAVITDVVIPWQDLFGLKEANGDHVKWLTGAMLERSMGRIGTSFISVAVMMAICTGINGFYLASSRLLFSMGRARMLPGIFSKISTKHHTPSVALAFVMVICFICPFFGRNVLSWVIDMCSVGTGIGYCYTCAAAFRMARADHSENSLNPVIALGGTLISAFILALLLLPISPAQMKMPSFVALGVWVLLGIIFYLIKRKEIRHISDNDLDLLILGKRKGEILEDEE